MDLNSSLRLSNSDQSTYSTQPTWGDLHLRLPHEMIWFWIISDSIFEDVTKAAMIWYDMFFTDVVRVVRKLLYIWQYHWNLLRYNTIRFDLVASDWYATNFVQNHSFVSDDIEKDSELCTNQFASLLNCLHISLKIWISVYTPAGGTLFSHTIGLL